MNIFKSKIEKLTLKITEENLRLLDVSERNSEYYLEKLFTWQDEYDGVEWEEFKDSWTYCERCKGYSEGTCICYARYRVCQQLARIKSRNLEPGGVKANHINI